MIPTIFSRDAITVFFNGRQQTADQSHPHFDTIKPKLNSWASISL
jgi:hypothetical protein